MKRINHGGSQFAVQFWNWLLTKKDETMIQGSKIKFLQYVKRRKLEDSVRNQIIPNELEISSPSNKINEYMSNWIDHVHTPCRESEG